MRVRHREDGPASTRTLGVSTDAGDVVDVRPTIGRRLIERRYFEVADGVCTEPTTAGAVCGQNEPCPYHGDGDEE